MIAAEAEAGAAPSATRIADAPRAKASWMKRAPSVFTPDNAAKRNPGFTSRLSAVSPVTGTDARPGGSVPSRPNSSPKVMV